MFLVDIVPEFSQLQNTEKAPVQTWYVKLTTEIEILEYEKFIKY